MTELRKNLSAGEFMVAPDPDDPRLVERCEGTDHEGAPVSTRVPVERPLTLYLNGQEIVTMMTIGDYPEYLAVGYLINQNMLAADDRITAINFDAEIDVVVVRTEGETNFEDKLRKKTLTSGCAQGTAFGDVMESFDEVELAPDAQVRTSWLYAISKKINSRPSIYLAAGAIHGCALCQEDRPLLYMEDVGRHNAIDKIAGYMFMEGHGPGGLGPGGLGPGGLGPEDKLFYTTGRLTSEMVIKCVQMRIPVLISRSGFTAWGVELARRANLTLIGRAKGRRFICLAGQQRIVYDADPAAQPDEPAAQARKGGRDG